MTDRIGNSQPTPKPQAPKTAPIKTGPVAVAPRQPQLGGDSAAISAAATGQITSATEAPQGGPGNGTLDSGSIGVGIQTFLQGIPRALGSASRALLGAGAKAGKVFSPLGKLSLRLNKGILLAADLLDGNNKAVGKSVGVGIAATRRVAPRLAGRHADKLVRAATPLIRGAGTMARALGKAAPVLNVLVAGYDTYKADQTKNPAERRAAFANAGLSIASTGLALGAVALGTAAGTAAAAAVGVAAAPVAIALGAGAAVIAGFQLVDTLAFGGKYTAKIAESRVGQAMAAGTEAVASGAKKAWNAITSL